MAAPAEVCSLGATPFQPLPWTKQPTRHATLPLVPNQVEQEAPKAAAVEAHGFKLVREQFVSEYNSLVLMYRHEKTGMPQQSCYPHGII